MVNNHELKSDAIIKETIESLGAFSSSKDFALNTRTLINLSDPTWSPALSNFELMAQQKHGAKVIKYIELAAMLPRVAPKSHILDYMCGEGYLTAALKRFGCNVKGYDKNQNISWERLGRANYVSELGNINSNFRLIILFDVLDNLELSDVIKILGDLKVLLELEGRIFIRFNPFSSRFGGRQSVNKSHIHLMLSPTELNQFNIKLSSGLKVVKPSFFYDELLKILGYKIIQRTVSLNPIDDFVYKNIDRIKYLHYSDDITTPQISEEISIEAIDYLIKPA